MSARTTLTRIGFGAFAALALGATAMAAPGASAAPFDPSAPFAPRVSTVDSAVYATPGGHGNFRWRYAQGAGHECRIIPVGRTAAVECDTKFPATTQYSSPTKPNAVRLQGRKVTAVNNNNPWAQAKLMAPNRQISVEGVTCTTLERASVSCTTTAGGKLNIVGGVIRR